MYIGSVLLTFALDIVKDVIIDWIKEKRNEIKRTTALKQLEEKSITVASKNGLNARNLYMETQKIAEDVIGRVPGIEVENTAFKKNITIDCDSKTKSIQLLQALNDAIDEIEQNYNQSNLKADNSTVARIAAGDNTNSRQLTNEACAGQSHLSRSEELLQSLRKRIEESESNRK